jgi:hypothetical protein
MQAPGERLLEPRAAGGDSPVALGFLGLIAGKALFMTWPAILLGGWLGVTIGMLITAPLYHWYVPLQKRTDRHPGRRDRGYGPGSNYLSAPVRGD